MILNIIDNGRILKNASGIYIPDFTVLTGENGSGKTQLLEFIRDNAGGEKWQQDEYGNQRTDEEGNPVQPVYFISNDTSDNLYEVIYTYPGLKSSNYIYGDQQQQPLIETIKQQWYDLEPIVLAYNSVKHKTFDNATSELQELNTALSRLVVRMVQSNTQNPPQARAAQLHQLEQLKQLSKMSGKGISDITLLDFIIFYIIPLDLFSAALDLLFHQFSLKRQYYEHLTRGVTPPLEVFNEILDKAKFKYRAEYLVSDQIEYPLPVKLVDRKNGKEVAFQNLSSGETTILALIFALYNSSNNGHFPQVILFDEPDAHLHPSLTQVFLDVIQEVLVKEHNVKVILTTHSPSTVALAPDESIYFMDRDLGHPVKEEKRAAINILSDGLASLTIEESSMGIAYNIARANLNIVFTEGITDKINLEIAWKKLYGNKPKNFFIQDCFSASVLGNLFTQADQAPDGIFHQFNKLKMIALFDFDRAGYAQWNNKKKFSDLIETDPKKGLTRYNGKNGYLMLLPVPNIPEIRVQVIAAGITTYKDQSHLTIESLLFHIEELKDYFTTFSQPGGGLINVFNENKSKRDFSASIEKLDSTAFKEFESLFEKIETILNSLSPN
jgi:predicted ATPase